MVNKYKFENFENPNFPVYSSMQVGDGVLVVPHFHNAVELNMIISGRVEMIIDTAQIECVEGDIVFIPPYSLHSARSLGGKATIKGMIYELDMINTNLPDIRLDEVINKERINEFKIDKNCSIYDDLSGAFLEAEHWYHEDGYTAKINILSHLYSITSLLINRYGYLADSEKNAMYDRIKPVIEYINENYQNKIYVSELGKLLCVCDDHLIRLFKSVTNKSPVQYITDKRVEKAMKMLIDTALPISEISARVGFSSANYMSNTFKSSIGMTPFEYRNKLKKKA